MLQEVFWLVSTPGSQQFRNYLHPSELKALIAPEKTTVNTIADSYDTDPSTDFHKIVAEMAEIPCRSFIFSRRIRK